MDEVVNNMHHLIIQISENRLGTTLTNKMVYDIKLFQGYIGLEFIIDTVKTIDIEELNSYLENLRNGLN